MIDYLDPVPPIVQFFAARLQGVTVYGNRFPGAVALPALLVRNAGGTDYSRIQLLYRADEDFDAMQGVIDAMNALSAGAAYIGELRAAWIEAETKPIPDTDGDTGKPEAWCYMRVEHFEA